MKAITLVMFLVLSFQTNAQISIQENTTIYLGTSSYLFENSKTDAGYLYNIILYDSAKAGDTIFRNTSGNPVSLILQTNLQGKLRWYFCMPGFFSENPFRINNKVAQIIHFTDSVYRVGQAVIHNPGNSKCYGIVSIDTSGQNLTLLKIGNEENSSGFSKLNINCLSYNTSGNIIISGYQNGAVSIGGQFKQSDSAVSTYFVAELNQNGALINYKPLFYTRSIYLLSRGIEYDNHIVFETGFDSLSISGKSYNALFVLNQWVNDVALISFNKNTREINNYKVFQDNSSNIYMTENRIICNANGILWPVNSSTSNVKLNDSLLTVNGSHKLVYIILDVNTLAYKKHFTTASELDGSIDIRDFKNNSFIMTFRYAGSYVKINNDSISIPSETGTTAFVVLDQTNIPKLVLSLKGQSNAVRLTGYSETQMDIWVLYLTPGSNLIAKNQTLNRNADHLAWKYQVSHYTFKNFSSISSVQRNDFRFYPNPTHNKIHFHCPSCDNLQIRIYNLGGQLTAEYFNTWDIDISDHANGLYLIELYADKQLIGLQKVLIQKD